MYIWDECRSDLDAVMMPRLSRHIVTASRMNPVHLYEENRELCARLNECTDEIQELTGKVAALEAELDVIHSYVFFSDRIKELQDELVMARWWSWWDGVSGAVRVANLRLELDNVRGKFRDVRRRYLEYIAAE